MGERVNGIHEATSSTLVSSTIDDSAHPMGWAEVICAARRSSRTAEALRAV